MSRRLPYVRAAGNTVQLHEQLRAV